MSTFQSELTLTRGAQRVIHTILETVHNLHNVQEIANEHMQFYQETNQQVLIYPLSSKPPLVLLSDLQSSRVHFLTSLEFTK